MISRSSSLSCFYTLSHARAGAAAVPQRLSCCCTPALVMLLYHLSSSPCFYSLERVRQREHLAMHLYPLSPCIYTLSLGMPNDACIESCIIALASILDSCYLHVQETPASTPTTRIHAHHPHPQPTPLIPPLYHVQQRYRGGMSIAAVHPYIA